MGAVVFEDGPLPESFGEVAPEALVRRWREGAARQVVAEAQLYQY